MALAVVAIYLDTRREKNKGVYPVKLRIYYNNKTRFYSTGFNLTKHSFEQSYVVQKPRGEYYNIKVQLVSIESKAREVIQELKAFSFEQFEKRMYRAANAGADVFYHYDQQVKQLKREDRIGTASSYELSSKSLKKFLASEHKKEDALLFDVVTPAFLLKYERWMLKEGNSLTTVGIYLRALRTVFNAAIADGEITQDLYPFGKRKYIIPSGRNIKKALSKEALGKLYHYELPHDSLMEKARDFWFFSYVCNGMNMRDIAELRYMNVSDETINFVRAKTKNTTRSKQKSIIVALSPHAKSVIQQYGNIKTGPQTFVFPILQEGMEEESKIRAIQTFTRFVNQHIKRLAKLAGVDPGISTYWARHSFTTIAIHSGMSMEYVQDSLGHSNIATTMNYWKGFEINVKKEMADKLMDI